MYKLIFTESYNKKAQRFLKRQPTIINQYKKCLELMKINPHHPSLRLHKLSGKLEGIYSVSINISYRITIDLVIQETMIIPISVGSHDEVY